MLVIGRSATLSSPPESAPDKVGFDLPPHPESVSAQGNMAVVHTGRQQVRAKGNAELNPAWARAEIG